MSTPFAYLTVTQANTVLTPLLGSPAIDGWLSGEASDDLKQRCLYQAAAVFEELPWRGQKEEFDQLYVFPRVTLVDESYYGDYLPYRVAVGYAILAAELAENYLEGSEDTDSLLSAGFSKVKIGEMEVDIAKGGSGKRKLVSDNTEIWLGSYLDLSSSGKGIKEVRLR